MSGLVAVLLLSVAVIGLAVHSRAPNAVGLIALAAAVIPESAYLPNQVGAGNKVLFLADILLPVAAAIALLRPSRTRRHDAFVWLFVLVMAPAIGISLILHGWGAASQDIRGPIYLVAGYLIGSRLLPDVSSRVVRRGSLVILGAVATTMLVQLVTGLPLLGGRVEEVRVYEGATGGVAIEATRFLTNTKVAAMIAVVVAVAVLVSSRSGAAARRWAALAIVPAVLITFLGYSRAILLSLLVALGLLAVLSRGLRASWRRPTALVAVLVALGAGVALLGVADAVNDPEGNLLARQVASFDERVIQGLSGDQLRSPGNEWRLVENSYAWEAFTGSPLWGHGFGASYRPVYVLDGEGAVFGDAQYGTRFIHNGHLGYLVRTGVVGFALFVLFIVLPAGRTVVAAIRSTVSPVEIGLAVAVLALLVDHGIEPDLSRIGGAPLVGAILGWLAFRRERSPAENRPPARAEAIA